MVIGVAVKKLSSMACGLKSASVIMSGIIWDITWFYEGTKLQYPPFNRKFFKQRHAGILCAFSAGCSFGLKCGAVMVVETDGDDVQLACGFWGWYSHPLNLLPIERTVLCQ